MEAEGVVTNVEAVEMMGQWLALLICLNLGPYSVNESSFIYFWLRQVQKSPMLLLLFPMYSPNQSLKKVWKVGFSIKCVVEWLRTVFANTFIFHSIQAKASNWINANVYWITDDIMLFRYLLFMVFILLHENKFYILWGYSMHCTLMSFVGWPEDFWLLAWKHQIN